MKEKTMIDLQYIGSKCNKTPWVDAELEEKNARDIVNQVWKSRDQIVDRLNRKRMEAHKAKVVALVMKDMGNEKKCARCCFR